MKRFFYYGRDTAGQCLYGQTQASSSYDVYVSLMAQGVKVIKLSSSCNFATAHIKHTLVDTGRFCLSLAQLLNSGIAILEAVKLIKQGRGTSKFNNLCAYIEQQVNAGESLFYVFSQLPQLFSHYHLALIQAGECAGDIEGALHKVATDIENYCGLKKRIKKALTYPTAVILVAFVVSTILMMYVVPNFAEMFASYNKPLPQSTAAVIAFSAWFSSHFYHLIIGTGILMLLVWTLFQHSVWRRWFFILLFSMPVINSWFKVVSQLRLSQSLSTLLAAAVPLDKALRLSSPQLPLPYQQPLETVASRLSGGSCLSAALLASKLFSSSFIQLVVVGEKTGRLDVSFMQLCQLYQRQVDDSIDTISELIEPFIMIFLGIMVGGLVVTMYLPMFDMGSLI